MPPAYGLDSTVPVLCMGDQRASEDLGLTQGCAARKEDARGLPMELENLQEGGGFCGAFEEQGAPADRFFGKKVVVLICHYGKPGLKAGVGWCMFNWSPALGRAGALSCSVCWLLWCNHSHHGPFQAVDMVPLNKVGKRCTQWALEPEEWLQHPVSRA